MKQLSSQARNKLDAIGRTETGDSQASVEAMFRKHGLPRFEPVIDAFLEFGGYVLPFDPEGRFKIYRAKQAIRMSSKSINASANPDDFRLIFGESETIQAFYVIDGNGKLFEDNALIATSMTEWIEDWAARGR